MVQRHQQHFTMFHLLVIVLLGAFRANTANAIAGTNCVELDPGTAVECTGWDGVTIEFPNGTISFSDQVIRYDPLHSGGPGPTDPKFTDPASALGLPDFPPGAGGEGDGSVSLGRGGLLNLLFVDNFLTNSGDNSLDLHVFQQFPLMACKSYTTYVGGCLCGQFDDPFVVLKPHVSLKEPPLWAPRRFQS